MLLKISSAIFIAFKAILISLVLFFLCFGFRLCLRSRSTCSLCDSLLQQLRLLLRQTRPRERRSRRCRHFRRLYRLRRGRHRNNRRREVHLRASKDTRERRLPADRQLLVVCKMGGRSSQATVFLREKGFDAINLAGGMVEWAEAGRGMVGDAEGQPLVV